MHARFDGYNYLLRLKKGDLLVASLTKFVIEKDIKGGWVMGLGGLAWAELGFYNLQAQAYEWDKLDEALELTSLQGNIAWQDNKPALHLHATVSDASFHARGGHVREAETAGTVELFIHVWNEDKLMRSRDNQTGLNLLDL